MLALLYGSKERPAYGDWVFCCLALFSCLWRLFITSDSCGVIAFSHASFCRGVKVCGLFVVVAGWYTLFATEPLLSSFRFPFPMGANSGQPEAAA